MLTMTPLLVEPSDMPHLPGVQSPANFYWILQRPTPLAGMSFP